MEKYLSLVKFSHTVFALPFALIGFFLGWLDVGEHFPLSTFVLMLLCMVTARSAAMAYNRWLDSDIDKLNERTATREIPSGQIKSTNVLLFVIANCILFITATYFINSLCFALSPIALLVILGYSYTKRFTSLCHMVLGLGLSLAPLGAYLSITSHFDVLPVLLSVAVLFWVSGFDIIYALQDEDFDREHQLNSIPSKLGRKNALFVARFFHLITLFSLGFVTWQLYQSYPTFGVLLMSGYLVFVSMLVYQHYIVSKNDLSLINVAFFTTNGIASVVFGAFFLLDIFF